MIFIYSFYSRKEKFYSKGKSTFRSESGPEPEKCGSEGQQRPTLIRRSKQPFLSSELQQKVCWTEGQPEGNAELFGAVTAFSSCLFRKHSLHVYSENTGPDLVLSALGNVTWWLSSRGRLSSGAGGRHTDHHPCLHSPEQRLPQGGQVLQKDFFCDFCAPHINHRVWGPKQCPSLKEPTQRKSLSHHCH